MPPPPPPHTHTLDPFKPVKPPDQCTFIKAPAKSKVTAALKMQRADASQYSESYIGPWAFEEEDGKAGGGRGGGGGGGEYLKARVVKFIVELLQTSIIALGVAALRCHIGHLQMKYILAISLPVTKANVDHCLNADGS